MHRDAWHEWFQEAIKLSVTTYYSKVVLKMHVPVDF